ncbi:hypothetical protein Taro_037352 [Colocasia esculenta]|uniref:Rhodanese domain-containing protein n=1 Tax=Colocasia esculenta TaxID=4460 RepID=A0A843WG06_COLES|nr:hypothetical protein [Colocasia esculenta]
MASASLLTRTFAGLRLVRSGGLPPAAYSTGGALFKRPCSKAPTLSPLVRSKFQFVRNAVTASSSGMETSVAQQATTSEPVVSVDWLHANLREPDLKVLDASWYMPDEQRNPLQEYQVAHIPGALFFDVDGISDKKTNLPHMLPSEGAFAAAVSALGIHNKDGIVVYDGKGIFSAARVWW